MRNVRDKAMIRRLKYKFLLALLIIGIALLLDWFGVFAYFGIHH